MHRRYSSYQVQLSHSTSCAALISLAIMALHSAGKGKLLAVIGDEVNGEYTKFYIWRVLTRALFQDTCVGFLLGGVGEINKHRQANFMVVDKSTCC